MALQQKTDNAEYWQQHDARTYECCRVWAEYEIARYIGAWTKHQFENNWCDAIGEIIAEERQDVRKQLAEGTKTLQARIAELETALQNHDKRHTEALERATQRITTLESEMAATRGAIEALNREVTDGVTKCIGDLEVTYWGRRETDEQYYAEQTKEINDRLTAFERNVGDIKCELADGVTKRIDDLEITYWGHRETDKHHQAEQTKAITDKLTAFTRQVDDVSYEMKEVRHDLARANDITHQIHQMEMRLDERNISANQAKRGPRGLQGPQGPKGDRGLAGLPGRDGKDAAVVTIQKWEVNPPEFTARAILTNGERMPALQLRGLFEEYQRQVGE